MPSAERLRIVQLIPTLRIGGLERVATTLTTHLVPHVERVVVCTSDGEAFAPVLAAAQIETIRIPRPRPRPYDVLAAAVALVPVLRRERPHVIHAHNPTAALAAATARLLARRPSTAIVTTYHGVPPERLARATRWMARASDLVVGVGEAATRGLVASGLRVEQARTVLNATAVEPGRSRADVRLELGIPDFAELVVTVGRYTTEKNQGLFLDAVAELRARRPEVRALVIGEGPLEDELRRHASAVGLDAAVIGPRADAVDLIAAADAFVLSSTWEGFGLVLAEAMAVSVPVVSTRAGGVADLVRDGVTGLLVPVGDAHALADAVERVLTDRQLRDRLVSAGAEQAATSFSPERMVDGYLAVYRDAVERRQASVLGRRLRRRRRAGARPSK